MRAPASASRTVGPGLARLVAGASAALLVAAGAWATPRVRLAPSPVSSVIYPEQEIRVAFDHAMHVRDVGLSCESCHELARTSRSPADELLPREAACIECHADRTRPDGVGRHEVTEACAFCHPGATDRVVRSEVPAARLRFSHAAHSGEECVRCHTRVPVRALATVDDLPGMRLCLGCHDGRRASSRCATCHLSEPDGVLRTELGAGARLLPPPWMHRMEHGPDWPSSHGLVAAERAGHCSSCHREHECLACHDGSVRPREVHPSGWMSLHAIEARAGDQRCGSCHRGQTFCRTCHLRAGVSQGSPPVRSGPTAERVHREPDWARGLPPRHGLEARRALTTCVSCHSGSDCVTCHRFVNPHPPGFGRRCRALVAAGSAACAACHASGPPPCGE